MNNIRNFILVLIEMIFRIFSLSLLLNFINIPTTSAVQGFESEEAVSVYKGSRVCETYLELRPECSFGNRFYFSINRSNLSSVSRIEFSINKKSTAHIILISIVDEERKKGHATRALKIFSENLQRNAFTEVTLFVDPENDAALSIYKKLGFKITQNIYQHYKNDMLYMKKILGTTAGKPQDFF